MLVCASELGDRNRVWQVNILIHLWKPIIHLINGWLHRGPLLAFAWHLHIPTFHSLLFPPFWPVSPFPFHFLQRTVYSYAQICTYEKKNIWMKIKQQNRRGRRRLPAIKVSHFDINFDGFILCCLKCFSSQALEKFISFVKNINSFQVDIIFFLFFSFSTSNLDTQCVENKSHETIHSGSSISIENVFFFFVSFWFYFF